MWSPRVWGSRAASFGFSALSLTVWYGKKATRSCPCGYLGDPSGRCRCSPERVLAYRGRLSGPLLDRIDMHLEVPAVPRALLLDPPAQAGESSGTVRERVLAARARQLDRGAATNSALGHLQVEHHCRLDGAARALLDEAFNRLGLSARAYHRILKVARTIADLAAAGAIGSGHLAEAIQYRCLDRRVGGG